MEKVDIYCDGACRGNGKTDAVGGWGAHSFDINMSICGGAESTTNNRMELTAAIKSLQWLMQNHLVDMRKPTANNQTFNIFTDSNYVKQGITEWVHGWKRRDWHNVKNVDLWQKLDKLNAHFKGCLEWHWVKGHDKSAGNNEADRLANVGCDSINN